MSKISETYQARLADGSLRPDPAQAAAVQAFARIEADLARPVKTGWFAKKADPVRGLYLWGGVGRGKSMLMDLFVEGLEVPARRVHFHAFMQEIHAAMHEARKTGVEDAIVPVADAVSGSVRVLAFDEMQITDITDAMIVGRLFERLFAAGTVVVTTSNRVPGDLYKDGLNRQLFLPFIALLEERMEVQELASPTDYRQDRLAGEEVYFAPVTPEARTRVAQMWEDLAGGDAPLVLTVKGRTVTLPAFRGGVARARFHDLCGQPLGPADYLAIADAVRVLIVEDVPRLGRSNFNEAKRFVTLIDALYEARVRLIVTAAAAPEMLYLEGENSFEFERTASRIREMMGDGWGNSPGG
ncbi:MAG: cell division protein ZapE [Pseudomonadota bacterium]